MSTPFVVFLGLIIIGIFGSLSTLIGIAVTFLKERRSGDLW